MKIAMGIIIALSVSIFATPYHEKPTCWVATVNGPQAVHEHYGPFASASSAQGFCARIPKAYRCEVEPVMPEVEWLRKGAR